MISFSPDKKVVKRLHRFLDKIYKKGHKGIEQKASVTHKNVFEHTNCLVCANCCKNHSPIITKRDLTRLAQHKNMTERSFYNVYVKTDSEGDYVFQLTPCPFLLPDNVCSVYEYRPQACRDYPHTDGKDFIKRIPITKKNTAVCPAVFEIILKLEKEINSPD